jgi:hypothetical protein
MKKKTESKQQSKHAKRGRSKSPATSQKKKTTTPKKQTLRARQRKVQPRRRVWRPKDDAVAEELKRSREDFYVVVQRVLQKSAEKGMNESELKKALERRRDVLGTRSADLILRDVAYRKGTGVDVRLDASGSRVYYPIIAAKAAADTATKSSSKKASPKGTPTRTKGAVTTGGGKELPKRKRERRSTWQRRGDADESSKEAIESTKVEL